MKHIIGVNVIFATWLFVGPLALGLYAPGNPAMWNDVIVGLMLLGSSACVLAELPGRAVYASGAVVCGVWLMSAPLLLSQRPAMYFYHLIIGALVVVASAVEAWRIIRRPVGGAADRHLVH